MNDKQWKKMAEAMAAQETMSWRAIAKALNKPRTTVSDHLRASMHVKWLEHGGVGADQDVIRAIINVNNGAGFSMENRFKMGEAPYPMSSEFKSKNTHESPHGKGEKQEYWEPTGREDNRRILFISDLHAPYQHPKALEFLAMLKEKYKPTRVISLGDEMDGHSISFHSSDPDLYGAGHELQAAQSVLKELERMFPVMDIVDSNHSSLLYRKGKHHGVPSHMLKGYNEVLGVGSGWKWHFDMLLKLPDGQDVYVHHGKNSSAIKTAQLMGTSHVCGHFHESFGIQYYSTPTKLLFGVNSGCLIDRKSLAFAYSNNNLKRPVIGTSLIIDGKPILETLDI